MFRSSCKKVSVRFTIISSIAAAAWITITRSYRIFLSRLSLKQNNVQSLSGDQKTTLKWQKLKLFSTDLIDLNLNCNDFFQ